MRTRISILFKWKNNNTSGRNRIQSSTTTSSLIDKPWKFPHKIKATENLMKKTTNTKKLWIGSNFHFFSFYFVILHPTANVRKMIKKKIEYKTIPLPNQYQLLIQRMKQMKNVIIIIFLCSFWHGKTLLIIVFVHDFWYKTHISTS